jgi:hypothetical protein
MAKFPTSGKRQPNQPVPSATRSWRPLWPIVLVVIGWGAVAFDFYDRHWLSPAGVDYALDADNARIELQPQPVFSDEKRAIFFNIRQVNNGKRSAMGVGHAGIVILGPIQPALIDAFFIEQRKEAQSVKFPDDEYAAGRSDNFFSLPGTPDGMKLDDNAYATAKAGSNPVFVFVTLKYSDDSIPAGKSIYTERCVYLFGNVVHNCDSGHNRSFIGD